MTLLAFLGGILVGIGISIAYNAWRGDSFDKITDDAKRKVKDL